MARSVVPIEQQRRPAASGQLKSNRRTDHTGADNDHEALAFFDVCRSFDPVHLLDCTHPGCSVVPLEVV